MRVLWKLNFLHTAMDGFNSPMEVPMMDNGSETGRMDLAAIFGRIAPSTRANGGMTSRMEWVKKYGVMDLALKALSGWERRLALQRSSGQEAAMKEKLVAASFMDKVPWFGLTDTYILAYGCWVR
mmetsp:Transcript_114735/g.272923  ORF Transcript_114735/g.272923 Transcript_114735/m.272923 type:complete len:125 (+) Transcript_114735:259-633(+)